MRRVIQFMLGFVTVAAMIGALFHLRTFDQELELNPFLYVNEDRLSAWSADLREKVGTWNWESVSAELNRHIPQETVNRIAATSVVVEDAATHQLFADLQQVATRQGLTLQRVSLTDDQGWLAELSDDVKVVLGQSNMHERFGRFAKLYDLLDEARSAKVKIADARYSQGIAITWKEK